MLLMFFSNSGTGLPDLGAQVFYIYQLPGCRFLRCSYHNYHLQSENLKGPLFLEEVLWF